MTARLVTLLVALYPRAWRARYGEEFRALLDAQPLTARVVLDVLGGAAREQFRCRPLALRGAVAVVGSVAVEWVALAGGFTDNVLWPPDTAPRVLLLAALLLAWWPFAVALARAAPRRVRRRAE